MEKEITQLLVIIWVIGGVLLFTIAIFRDWYNSKDITIAYFFILLPICIVIGWLGLFIAILFAFLHMANSITIIKGRNN